MTVAQRAPIRNPIVAINELLRHLETAQVELTQTLFETKTMRGELCDGKRVGGVRVQNVEYHLEKLKRAHAAATKQLALLIDRHCEDY